MELKMIGNRAKAAAFAMIGKGADEKNQALNAIADSFCRNKDMIIRENQKDCAAAEKNRMRPAMIDRLRLDETRVIAMADALRYIVTLADPIGGADNVKMHPSGMRIEKRRVPLGVVAIIYESRPNVTADCIGLCIKSGNAVVLRGGSEAINSNRAIVHAATSALESLGFPEGLIGFVDDTSRESSQELMKMNEFIDVLIPRGGANLIQTVVENATVPVIETGTGNCHIYIDKYADLKKAVDIAYNAKCSRPSVCNAAEKFLVSEAVAAQFLRSIEPALKAKGVEIRGCKRTLELIDWAIPATTQDWVEEYNDYIVGIKIVKGLDEAISHINAYNTKHSECIVTENYTHAQIFLSAIDAAAVYVNASTRFTDGGVFGLGAEIGISTQKLHARGPMGLEALTSYKYCIYGGGQIRV